MKRSIMVVVTVLALACGSGIAAAQEGHESATMQRGVTVTATAGHYETYALPLAVGFSLQARVGNTHREYLQATRAASQLEQQRMQGLAQEPFVTVAIDNSTGSGAAWEYRLADQHDRTLAIVDVYCKRAASAGNHCRMVSRRFAGESDLAVLPGGQTPLALVQAVAH